MTSSSFCFVFDPATAMLHYAKERLDLPTNWRAVEYEVVRDGEDENPTRMRKGERGRGGGIE